VGWFVSAHVAPGLISQTKKQLSEQSVRRWRINLIEVDGAKLKCVYWITQHKDRGKGKNWDILKTVGRGVGHGARLFGIADCGLRISKY
jgi:hypothetical protein